MGKNRRTAFVKKKGRLNRINDGNNSPSNFNEKSQLKPRFRRRMPPSSSFKKFGTSGANFQFKTPNPKPRENKKTRMYLREEQVGITEFVSEGAGFFGIIKTRLSDYLVNEIDVNGKVLRFTDLTIPIMIQETEDKQERAGDAQAEENADETRQKWNFPGDYVHFVVFTDYLNTNLLVLRLASNMGIQPSEISFCSTKGKNVKNVQKFCIKYCEPSQIANAAQKISEIRVGNFEFSNEKLKLGDTKGNQFKITLRYVRGNPQDIEKSLTNLREHGFINYFGVLRFAHHQGTPTYEVGAALLKSDYKTVVELIMKPNAYDLPFMSKMRKIWWEDRDSAAAAAVFRGNDFVEKRLLDALVVHGEDYCSALEKLPRNMILLYPHAFQSLVFNRIASRRIEKFGMQLLPGDFVYLDRDEMDEYIVEHSEVAEICDSNDEESEESMGVENEGVDSVLEEKVKSLTEEDIVSGEYTIYDVVLPLLGYDVTYPDNEVGSWYNEILEEYGLSTDYLCDNITSYSLVGSYRKFVMRPTDFTWKYRKYSNPEEYLMASDWDYITGNAAEIEKTKKGGESTALLLHFSLPPTVYTTVLLRELLKLDKSAPTASVVMK